MAGRKRRFPCGHVGRGQYCHRCAQEKQAREQARAARQAWAERLAAAPVALESVPRHVAEKVLQIIAELEQGKRYQDFKGKRLALMGQRDVISIPVGWSHRLICREGEAGLEYVEVISHETYNKRLAAGGWRS